MPPFTDVVWHDTSTNSIVCVCASLHVIAQFVHLNIVTRFSSLFIFTRAQCCSSFSIILHTFFPRSSSYYTHIFCVRVPHKRCVCMMRRRRRGKQKFNEHDKEMHMWDITAERTHILHTAQKNNFFFHSKNIKAP
jgi:hypothetical protein